MDIRGNDRVNSERESSVQHIVATLQWNTHLPEEQPEKCGNNLIPDKTKWELGLLPMPRK